MSPETEGGGKNFLFESGVCKVEERGKRRKISHLFSVLLFSRVEREYDRPIMAFVSAGILLLHPLEGQYYRATTGEKEAVTACHPYARAAHQRRFFFSAWLESSVLLHRSRVGGLQARKGFIPHSPSGLKPNACQATGGEGGSFQKALSRAVQRREGGRR